MDGELLLIDGRSALRFERRLAHPPEKVWRAITEAEQLVHWFPAAVELEHRLGAEVRFDFGDGSGPTPNGVVTAFEPPRVFGFSWGGDLLHFELHPDGTGCRLVFTHHFDDRAGAASFAPGWKLCLDAFEMLLDGREIVIEPDTGELHEAYVAALGLDEGTAEASADGWRVRLERQLIRPADVVWTMLSAASQQPAPAVGGPVPPGFTSEQVAPGRVIAADAPALLEYEWLWEGRPAGVVRWELGQGTGHGARLILTQTGPADLANAQAAALASWQARVAQLATDLLGEPRSVLA